MALYDLLQSATLELQSSQGKWIYSSSGSCRCHQLNGKQELVSVLILSLSKVERSESSKECEEFMALWHIENSPAKLVGN